MNKFIELRSKHLNLKNNYYFIETYLNSLTIEESLSNNINFYKKSISKLKDYNNKDLSENDLLKLFTIIGDNQYIDTYVIGVCQHSCRI